MDFDYKWVAVVFGPDKGGGDSWAMVVQDQISGELNPRAAWYSAMSQRKTTSDGFEDAGLILRVEMRGYVPSEWRAMGERYSKKDWENAVNERMRQVWREESKMGRRINYHDNRGDGYLYRCYGAPACGREGCDHFAEHPWKKEAKFGGSDCTDAGVCDVSGEAVGCHVTRRDPDPDER